MPTLHPARFAFPAAVALLCAACPTRDVSKVDPSQSRVLVRDVAVSTNRDIDVLFLIDNSSSMADKQQSLVDNFPRFINVLQNIPGGLPNVHIGVTSSNVGVGGFNIGGCGGSGDDGRLQNTPRGSCNPPMGNYISDIANPDGTRTQNYTGTLADTFTCIAKLGDQGCGFEHHFEGVKRALDGHNPANAGFLRPDAFLAVVIVGDEDDCSAQDTAVFDPSQTKVTDPLGPLASYRCTEFGIECCDGSIAEGTPCTEHPIGRSSANFSNCLPLENPKYIYHPKHYVDFLKSLKPDPDHQIIVSIIGGNPTPVGVSTDSKGNPALNHSCTFNGPNGAEVADPAVRFNWLASQFHFGQFTSICNNDLSDAMTKIADQVKLVIGSPCLVGPVDTTDLHPELPGLQLDCTVTDILDENTDHQQETEVPRCPMQDDTTIAAGAPTPCWYVATDTMHCTAADEPTHLTLSVNRGASGAPIGTVEKVACVEK